MLRCVGRSIQSCLASRLAQTAAHWCEQNAALTVMTVLLSRVLLYFKLNLYIPLSKVLYMSLLQPLYSPSLQPLYMPLFARNVYMPLSEALPPSTTLGAKSIGGGGGCRGIGWRHARELGCRVVACSACACACEVRACVMRQGWWLRLFWVLGVNREVLHREVLGIGHTDTDTE
jgi:hypothetical protein